MLWIALHPPHDAASTLPSPPHEGTAPAPDVQALSWWALQFSPRVTVLEGAVLLEVQASERLFGGRKALLQRIQRECGELQVSSMAVAPTALAARGLLRCMACPTAPDNAADTANAAPTVAVAACTLRTLAAVLDALPLSALLATAPHEPTLQRLGCSQLGQVRALPRGGVSRRFGAALLSALDQAYGQQIEIYPWVTLPEQFSLRLEFNSRIELAEGLMFGAHRLLGSLKAWLTARQSGVAGISLHWEHDLQRRGEAKAGSLVVRTGQASRDTQHLARLLAEHLARTELLAPVVAITLQALDVEPLPTISASLLQDDAASGESLQQLLERLSARLGAQRVLTGQTVADHRPQRIQAWVPCVQVSAASMRAKTQAARAAPDVPGHWASYPCWILRQPLRLAVVHDKPIYQGPLQLMAGPERIETGWWPQPDGGLTDELTHDLTDGLTDDLTLRDYFIASSEMAGLLWIYRQRMGLVGSTASGTAQVGWYLHGIYG
jgi:protein ImuB